MSVQHGGRRFPGNLSDYKIHLCNQAIPGVFAVFLLTWGRRLYDPMRRFLAATRLPNIHLYRIPDYFFLSLPLGFHVLKGVS
jgi:hypothetical protein